MSLKLLLTKIWDCIWPHLTGDSDKPTEITAGDLPATADSKGWELNVSSPRISLTAKRATEKSECYDIGKRLQYLEKLTNNEVDRRKTVETKSSIFIGITAGIATLITGISNLMLSNNSNVGVLQIIIFGFLLIYLIRTLYHSLNVLRRKRISTISPKKLLDSSLDDREMFVCMYNNLQKNYTVTNNKVDQMTLAQECFRNAIFSILIYFATMAIPSDFFSNLSSSLFSFFANLLPGSSKQ